MTFGCEGPGGLPHTRVTSRFPVTARNTALEDGSRADRGPPGLCTKSPRGDHGRSTAPTGSGAAAGAPPGRSRTRTSTTAPAGRPAAPAARAAAFRPEVDTAWVGHDTRAIFWITAAPSALSSVGQALAAHPGTAYVAATTGSSNLVAVVICSSTPELYRYLSECVGALDGVRHVETVPSLRLVKQITTEGIR